MNKFNLGRVRGEDGKSATIAIGTITTGQAGSDASVNNVGDSLHAILDFTIPRGDKGEKGDRGNEAYSAGSNVQITGGVISATDTTYAPATVYADGLMSKEDKVRLGGIEAGAQVNTVTSVNGRTGAVAGLAENTDPRLSDAREWSAATVTQLEAETGTAATRRAWTAQRVWQAINAWWNTIGAAFGKTLLGSADAAAARGSLGLGTAATRDVGTASDQIPLNSALSGYLLKNAPNPDSHILLGTAQSSSGDVNNAIELATTTAVGGGVYGDHTGVRLVAFGMAGSWGTTKFGVQIGTNWREYGPVREILHTGNIQSTTGQSTLYPMTQKAVTDAINGISDERDKTEINEIGLGLEVIENLKTFSFQLNNRDWYRQEAAKELIEVEEDGKVTIQEKINDDVLNAPLSDFEENDGSLKRDDVYTGFVAQDLKETLEELDLGHLGIVKNYADEYEGGDDRFYIEHLALLPFLVNSIKQLSARVKALEGRQVE